MAIAAPPAPNHRVAKPVAVPGLEVRRMSLDDFWRLPDKPKAEWLDGWAVIHVAPSLLPHSEIVSELIKALGIAFPHLKISTDGALAFDNWRLFPDIMLYEPQPKGTKVLKQTPILVIEVLSRSTRRYDLTTKYTEFSRAGIQQYWTADTNEEEIIVRENVNGAWVELAKLDADHPIITVTVGKYGEVTLDRNKLFS